jgi:hypothetical protein
MKDRRTELEETMRHRLWLIEWPNNDADREEQRALLRDEMATYLDLHDDCTRQTSPSLPPVQLLEAASNGSETP